MTSRQRRRLDTRTWFRRKMADHAPTPTGIPRTGFFLLCWVAWCQYRDARRASKLG